MKRMKQAVSWLLVLAMIISLMPANLAQAEGEEGYSIYLDNIIACMGNAPYGSYGGDDPDMEGDWKISVPDQDNVEVSADDNWTWNVTGDFTFYITIPEECNVEYLSLKNNDERMEDVSFVETDEERKYSITLTPTEDMRIGICDDTYSTIDVKPVLCNFSWYIAGVDSQESVNYYKRGESYKLHVFRNEGADVDIESLSFTLNGTKTNLVAEADGTWSYTFSNLAEVQNVKLLESGVKFAVSMPDLSEYGYEIYDANGENKIAHDGSEDSVTYYEVEQGGNLTFQVKKTTGTMEYGLYVDEEELVATSDVDGVRTYTISNVTWDTGVNVSPKYRVSFADDNMKMIPCTETGEELSPSVNEYYVKEWGRLYFKLDVGDALYQISYDNNIVSKNNEIYYLDITDSPIELTAKKIYTVLQQDTNAYRIQMGNDEVSYEGGDMIGNYYQYYVVDPLMFSVISYSDYNADNMKVKLKDADGNVTELEIPEGTLNESGELVYNFETTINEDVEIVVEGIYQTESTDLTLQYDQEKFADVTIEVLDGNNAPLSWNEDMGMENEVSTSINVGLPYTLVITGAEETLQSIRMNSEGTDLSGTIRDGKLIVDITNLSTIQLVMGEEYYITGDWTEDATGMITLREFGSEDNKELKGYYPKGNVRFWIDEDDNTVTAEDTYIVSIKDSEGNDVSYTKEENVEVDDYGTKRTVYTVNLTSDIVIKYAGSRYLEYDVYLPIPENDDYIISNLYKSSWEWDDNLGTDVEVPDYFTGVADTANQATKYAAVTAGTEVKFDITTATDNGTPFVQINISQDGNAWTEPLSVYSSVPVDDTHTKYTYSFYVNGMSDIDISVNSETITVVATGNQEYFVLYNAEEEAWKIYGEDPTMASDDISPIVELYGLPEVIDKNDTERQYYMWYSVTDNALMLDDQNNNNFFTVKDANDAEQNLMIVTDESDEHYGYYNVPVQDGYYVLEVDMSQLEPKNGKVSFVSRRDDIEISIEGTEGEDYVTLEGQTYDYKVKNQQLTFSVTAVGVGTFPDDVYVGMSGYTWDESYTASPDGLTRTYTLMDVAWDGTIIVAYGATIEFEECANGGMYSNVLGDHAIVDEEGNITNYGTYASYREIALNLSVNEGYDVDSVSVVQKYIDEEGNEQTEIYTDLEPYESQNTRICEVYLQPGKNVFSMTAPKKKTYTMSLPSSVAYSIELVNGSKTTVEYKDAFSFKVNAKDGYDLSSIIVSANGQKMTPDANGVYTVKNVAADYEITITGLKTSKHVVTFKDYNGKVLKTQTVDHGKAATAPANPTRDGYTFTGWNTTFTKVVKDMTVTATYKPVLVSKLKIAGDSTALAVGKTMKLTATATPTGALNKDVVWTTSNKKYATVSSTGKVKALKKGAGKTVKITATAKDGSGVKATYKIKIYKSAIKKIKLTAKTKTVKAGKKVTVKVTLTPSKNVFKTLQWSSSNKKWATVNSKGVVTTKKAGKGKTVKITAKAMDGSNKKAIIKIKIKK